MLLEAAPGPLCVQLRPPPANTCRLPGPPSGMVPGLPSHAAEVPVQYVLVWPGVVARRQILSGVAKRSAGQVNSTPLHASGASHRSITGRQMVRGDAGPQVPLCAAPAAVLHACQSVTSPPPQSVLQQTPSTQMPVGHSLAFWHASPRCLISTAPRVQRSSPRVMPR